MLAPALFPLAAYFLLLAVFSIRRTPTILNGSEDFLFLSAGLFGLLTLGPGRLLIPLQALNFWGVVIWVFWTAFYFAVSYIVSCSLNRRIVIYRASMEETLPKLIELARNLDPKTLFQGNVLYLPGFGMQFSVRGSVFKGHILLSATHKFQDRWKWQQFEQKLENLCQTAQKPQRKAAIVWATLALGLFLFAGYGTYNNIPVYLEVFKDYWG